MKSSHRGSITVEMLKKLVVTCFSSKCGAILANQGTIVRYLLYFRSVCLSTYTRSDISGQLLHYELRMTLIMPTQQKASNHSHSLVNSTHPRMTIGFRLETLALTCMSTPLAWAISDSWCVCSPCTTYSEQSMLARTRGSSSFTRLTTCWTVLYGLFG